MNHPRRVVPSRSIMPRKPGKTLQNSGFWVVGVDPLGYTTNMGSTVLLAEAAEAIDTIGHGLDALFASGMSPADDRDAIVWITELETLGRRVAAAQTGLLDVIDRDGLFTADGHASAKVMVRHHAKLSEGEAKARTQVVAACRDLPDVSEAWQAGQVGAAQMRVIGEVHANPRVRPEMEERQQRLLDDAQQMSARRFAQTTRGWARLVDQDGPQPAGERCHERRDSKLIPDPIDSSWTLTGSFGSMYGAEMREILDHFIDAEFKTDWAEAKARVGERVTKADLDRTDAQRRADAMLQLFRDAASAPEGAVPPGFIHNIHWSAESYENSWSRSLVAVHQGLIRTATCVAPPTGSMLTPPKRPRTRCCFRFGGWLSTPKVS